MNLHARIAARRAIIDAEPSAPLQPLRRPRDPSPLLMVAVLSLLVGAWMAAFWYLAQQIPRVPFAQIMEGLRR